MAQGIALINGEAYDFTKIVVNILGLPISGISAVNYTQEQTKENVFGAGVLPVARGRGEKNAGGSIDLQMNEVERLRGAAPDGGLTSIPPFDITVTYLVTGKVKVHTLKNCEFTNDGVEASQGDTSISRSFDLVMSHVLYN